MSDFKETFEKFKEMVFKETGTKVAYSDSELGESILESYFKHVEMCNRIDDRTKAVFVEAMNKRLLDDADDPYGSEAPCIKNEGCIMEDLDEEKKPVNDWSGFMQEEKDSPIDKGIPSFVMISDVNPYDMKVGEEREVEVLMNGQVVKTVVKKQSTSAPYYPVKNYRIKNLGGSNE